MDAVLQRECLGQVILYHPKGVRDIAIPGIRSDYGALLRMPPGEGLGEKKTRKGLAK